MSVLFLAFLHLYSDLFRTIKLLSIARKNLLFINTTASQDLDIYTCLDILYLFDFILYNLFLHYYCILLLHYFSI